MSVAKLIIIITITKSGNCPWLNLPLHVCYVYVIMALLTYYQCALLPKLEVPYQWLYLLKVSWLTQRGEWVVDLLGTAGKYEPKWAPSMASTLLPERKYRYKNGLQSVVKQLPFTLCSLTTMPHFPAQAALDCVSTIWENKIYGSFLSWKKPVMRCCYCTLCSINVVLLHVCMHNMPHN